MKARFAMLVIALALSMVLSACGSSAVDNAEDFIKAASENDLDKAKDVTCEDLHAELEDTYDEDDEGFDLDDLECEEEDDDRVRCTYEIDGEDMEVTFIMDDDDKICDVELGEPDLPAPVATQAPTPVPE